MSDSANPIVGILMGSASDWPTVQHASLMLTELGVAHESNVLSAHRTPQAATDYATSAMDRGIKVLICAAAGGGV